MVIKTWGTATADYLDLGAAVSALPLTPVEKWVLLGVGPTTNNSPIIGPSDFNGQDLEINGGGFLFTSNISDDDIEVLNVTNSFKFYVNNFRVKFNALKSSNFTAFAKLNTSNANFYVNDNIIDGNGNGGLGVYHRQSLAYCEMCRNVIYDCARGLYANHLSGSATTQTHFANNTIYGCSEFGILSIAGIGIVSIKNNNVSNSTSDYNPSVTDATITDLDWNVSSDSTGSPGHTNILATDAMVDPVGGDYTPIKGGPLYIPGDKTYAGAIQLPKQRRRSMNLGISLSF